MKIIKYPLRSEWSEIIKRPQLDISQLALHSGSVLGDVKNNGDSAVIIYEEKFDKVRLTSVCRQSTKRLTRLRIRLTRTKDSLMLAHDNIARFLHRFLKAKIEAAKA